MVPLLVSTTTLYTESVDICIAGGSAMAVILARAMGDAGFVHGARVLAQRDEVMARLVEIIGPPRLRPRQPSGFEALARAISFQQLATGAAAAIYGRFRGLVDGPLNAEAVLALPTEAMRSVGLSRAKTRALQDLARREAQGELRLRGISRLDDAAIVDRLVSVRGIGEWTAQMFLIFQLRRLDVWPTGDLGVRHGYGIAHRVDPAPNAEQLEPLGDPFRPYRSVAAWYCWRSTDSLPAPP